MATDFSYNKKQIVSSGPFKPSGQNFPIDARTRVEVYADISSIPNPFIGMRITVLADETNSNKMTDYIVKSLKANSSGIADMAINEVVRYVDYLGISSGSSGGSSSSGTGGTIDTSNLASDLSLSGTSLQLKNSAGNLIGNAVKLPTTSGSSSADLTNYPTKSEVLTKTNSTAFTPTSDYNPATKKYVDDSINSLSFEAGDISLTDYVIGCSLKLAEIEPVYGSLNLSTNSISGNEGTAATFTVKLNSAPNTTQTVDVACSHAYIYLSPQKLTFTPSNYNAAQTVTVSLLEDPTYTNWETSITVSSLGVNTQTINVSVTNITEEPVVITGISLNKSSLNLNEGASETLTATITPSNADTAYAWKSSATNIATVENGLVTAIAEGSATITCYSVVDKSIKAECSVTVTAVAIESITLPETATVNRNRTITLTPTIVPNGLTNYAWSIDNENASVNNGVVTGVTAGTSVVTCYYTKNNSIKDTTAVTIEEVPIESITFDSETVSVIQGKTVTLTPTITPSDATVGYTWSVNNENATVVDGVVTGVNVGSAIVTCTSNANNNIKASCEITINEKPVRVIDNVAIKDDSLYFVFDARDGSNEEQTMSLEDRVEHETPVAEFIVEGGTMEFDHTTGFSDNGLRHQYSNIIAGDQPTKLVIRNMVGLGENYENTATYKQHTFSFGYNNIDIVPSTSNFNSQFIMRGGGYGIGLCNKEDGLYWAIAYNDTGSQERIGDTLIGKTFITFRWNGTGVDIFINGTLIKTIPYASIQNDGAFYKYWTFFTQDSPNKEGLFAQIQLATCHTRALTDDEIMQNYNAYMGV